MPAVIALTLLAGCSSGALGPIAGARLEGSRPSSQAARVSVIHSFSGAPLSSTPEAGLIADGSGNLYGTAVYGGTPSKVPCDSGCGAAFELSPQKGGTWNETVLYSFKNSETGLYPSNPLILDAAGNLYGTTPVGGSQGVAYELVHRAGEWHYKVLHIFMGCRDGQQPESGLTEFNGNLYGTTVAGGNSCSGGNGTVFEFSHVGGRWKYAIIYRFRSYSDGMSPQAGLTYDSSGNLYGTTAYGGNSNCGSGCGMVFELSRSRTGRWSEKVLHQFSKTDGALPDADLVWGPSGELYGSTNQGANSGCPNGCGTIFTLTRGKRNNWRYSIVHAFIEQQGGGPAGNMVFDESGNLYGSTVIGGSGGDGVLFELAPAGGKWTYTVLHDFTSSPDGAEPNGVVMAGRGKFFGTTIGGGDYSMGSAFEVEK
ncbi:MAG: hypothetical protein JO113_04700 [Candidatus Eremiobacteraeota bacterium]|nr:hypothetical protein [Candidatus Eremiobacteraeota bacterium]